MKAYSGSRPSSVPGDPDEGLQGFGPSGELNRRARNIEQKGRCVLGRWLLGLSRFQALHPLLFRLACAFEGGTMFSQSLRMMLSRHYDVAVGMYSYGECLRPGLLPPGTRIGNYCSIADGLLVLRRNHPTDRLSQHALFFNHEVGLVSADSIGSIESNPLLIGHDVWIGSRVVVTPACRSIGNGAVVAAGAVVTADVAPFEIVGGVPAKRIRARFPAEVQRAVEASQWWLRPLSELANWLPRFQHPLNAQDAQRLNDSLAKINRADSPASWGN